MKRRHTILAILAALTTTPALAAETPARRRAGSSSSGKPGVAERSNNRVRRTTETSTATKVKTKANKGDDAMNRLVGNKKRASR